RTPPRETPGVYREPPAPGARARKCLPIKARCLTRPDAPSIFMSGPLVQRKLDGVVVRVDGAGAPARAEHAGGLLVHRGRARVSQALDVAVDVEDVAAPRHVGDLLDEMGRVVEHDRDGALGARAAGRVVDVGDQDALDALPQAQKGAAALHGAV